MENTKVLGQNFEIRRNEWHAVVGFRLVPGTIDRYGTSLGREPTRYWGARCYPHSKAGQL